MVWKNVDHALSSTGDVDSLARRQDWPVVERIFRDWADDAGCGPVVACRHFSNVPILVVLPPGEPLLLELDVRDGKPWNGAPLFRMDDLGSLATMDPRGFRRLRAGAEGVLKLALNGMTGSGGANRARLRDKGVGELLRSDPEGARAAARLFGSAAAPMIQLATAVADGRWDRPAALAVLGLTFLRGMRDPATFARRARFRLSLNATIASCPVLRTIWHDDRRVDVQDREAWLERALLAHSGPVELARVRP
jgi:hypothetical protein